MRMVSVKMAMVMATIVGATTMVAIVAVRMAIFFF
jgi:hypothetical protein